ncbi:unnamed protein product [Symbiodinium sp. CCMP2592]|nr:unnamed protein product [Symbiodinium sp. CCMP2592]
MGGESEHGSPCGLQWELVHSDDEVVMELGQDLAESACDTEASGVAFEMPPCQIDMDGHPGVSFEDGLDNVSLESNEWVPGMNCGSTICSLSPALQQAQVLIVNTVANIKKLPKQLTKDMLCGFTDIKGSTGKSYTEVLAANLLGLSRQTVSRCWRDVEANGWTPIHREPLHPERKLQPNKPSHTVDTEESRWQPSRPSHTVDTEESRWRKSATVCVRTAIGCAVEGQSRTSFEREVARLRLCGVDVDGAMCHSRKFCVEVEYLTNQVLHMMNANDWCSVLGGLGIESDFAVMADPVSLGKCSAFPRNETVLVANLTIVSAEDGSLVTPMLDYRTLGIGCHSGSETTRLLLEMLSQHPSMLDLPILKARLAMIDGDGQIVKGGAQARHSSGGAAELLWQRVHPEAEPDSLVVCTRWDDFHRRVGATGAGLRGPGGTRKVVYLSGAPGGLISNYQIVLLCLHGKVAWKKEGKGNVSLTSLFEVGRRLQEPSFVFFLVGFDVALLKIVRPFALIVQKAEEASVVEKARRNMEAALETMQESFAKVKIMLGAVACCRQYVSSKELARLMSACRYTSWGKPVRSFILHASKVLFNIPPEFQGCKLQLNAQLAPGMMSLGGHCQCLAAEEHCRRARRRAVPEIRRVKTKIYVFRRGRRVQKTVSVPLWTMLEIQKDASFFCPRQQLRDTTKNSVLGMDYSDMFRPRLPRANWLGSRCQVPNGVFQAHAACVQAIEALMEFLKYAKEEVDDIFSDVGMNSDMLSLLRAGEVAFDWTSLLAQPPTRACLTAFGRLVEMFKPYLAKGRWPHGDAFQKVPQTWSLQKREFTQQYELLVSRVRQCYEDTLEMNGNSGVPAQTLRKAMSWSSISGYMVSPVNSFPGLRWTLGKALRLPGNSPAMAYVACTVSQFLGSWNGHRLTKQDTRRFEVSERAVRKYIGPCTSKRRMNVEADSGSDSCRVGVLQAPRNLKGKLVILEEPLRKVDPSCIAASLDTDPWFSLGDSHSPHSWHETLMVRVMLQQAHVSVTGHSRDELLVRAVVHLLERTHARLKKTSRPKELSQVQALHARIENSGRWHSSFFDGCQGQDALSLIEPDSVLQRAKSGQAVRQLAKDALASGLPSNVPQTIHDSWVKVLASGVVAALPMGVSVQRKSAGKAAPSTIQARLDDWLVSEEGKKWQVQRQRLWAPGSNVKVGET